MLTRFSTSRRAAMFLFAASQVGCLETAKHYGPEPAWEDHGETEDGAFGMTAAPDELPPFDPSTVELPDAGAAPMLLLAATPTAQSTIPADTVAHPPAVYVLDPQGQPLPGVEVQFEVVRGDDSVLSRSTVRSEERGLASSGGWRLGRHVGTFAVRALVPEIPTVPPTIFYAEGVSDFHIDLVFTREPSPAQREAFELARRRWEAVVLNAQPRVEGSLAAYAEQCGFSVEDRPVASNGVTIFVRLEPIDGRGKILGRAGPCLLRRENGSPAFGGVTLDTADLDGLEKAGFLKPAVLHEMGHVLGIGTLWGNRDLLVNPSLPDAPEADTHFVGENARVAFEELLGRSSYAAGIVPVENRARSGSSDGHWRESVAGHELMTPALTRRESSLPLSLLTIASVEDLGFYEANFLAHDEYALPRKDTDLGLLARGDVEPECDLVRPIGIVDSAP